MGGAVAEGCSVSLNVVGGLLGLEVGVGLDVVDRKRELPLVLGWSTVLDVYLG